MKKVILSILLLVVLFTTYASAKKSSSATCLSQCLSALPLDKRSERHSAIKFCVESCSSSSSSSVAANLRKKLNHLSSKIDQVAQNLLDRDVQKQEAVFSDEIALLSDAQSESAISNGDILKATAGLNIRSGPCTTHQIVGGLANGQTTTFTGRVQSGCGYTWYSIPNGWVASSFVQVVGGGGSSCTTRSYPLFKQCDSRWGGNALGTSSVCRIGCLMSSVSMALNGLGKSINGQSPNPGTLNQFLRNNGGYQGNLFIWGSVARFGLRYIGQPSNKSEIRKHICANNVVILNVNNGGHWVLATGVSADGSTFYVNDPGYSRSSYRASEVGVAGIFTL